MRHINSLENVEHFHLKVLYDEMSQKLIYDRKLSKGSGSAVYGLEVAKALNLDSKFLSRAYEIRDEIMKEESELSKLLNNPKKSIYNSRVLVTKCAICGAMADDVHHILPKRFAINSNIKHLPKHHKSNLVPLCKKHHKMVHSNEIKINGFRDTTVGIELDFEFLDDLKE
jgi:DNA mismatch repair protein MutS